MRFLFYLQGNCTDFEATVAAQCDALIEAIKKRKQELLVHVAEERDLKISMLKEQASQCTALLQRTTGLLHFSIEVLKESDPASFLQVCTCITKNNNSNPVSFVQVYITQNIAEKIPFCTAKSKAVTLLRFIWVCQSNFPKNEKKNIQKFDLQCLANYSRKPCMAVFFKNYWCEWFSVEFQGFSNKGECLCVSLR